MDESSNRLIARMIANYERSIRHVPSVLTSSTLVLAWWDVLAAPICLLWFLSLCYLFCITFVRSFLIEKGTAKAPFLMWGESPPEDPNNVFKNAVDGFSRE